MMRIFTIGAENGSVCSSARALEQIEEVKKFTLNIQTGGEQFSWDDLDWRDGRGGESKVSLMQSVVNDRKMRVDEKQVMNSRPPFIECHEDGGEIVRWVYFEYDGEDGHYAEFDFKKEGA